MIYTSVIKFNALKKIKNINFMSIDDYIVICYDLGNINKRGHDGLDARNMER